MSPPPAASECAAEGVAVAPHPASLINAAWGFLPDSKPAYVRLYQPNYILFGRYTTGVNTEPYQPLLDAFAEEGDFQKVEPS